MVNYNPKVGLSNEFDVRLSNEFDGLHLWWSVEYWGL